MMNEKKKELIEGILFVIVTAALIMTGIYACGVPVVPMCLLLILQSAVAALLHRTELWMHIAMLLVELIASVLAQKVAVMALCIVMYVVATAMFQIWDKDKKEE
jgi:hypothetical protein